MSHGYGIAAAGYQTVLTALPPDGTFAFGRAGNGWRCPRSWWSAGEAPGRYYDLQIPSSGPKCNTAETEPVAGLSSGSSSGRQHRSSPLAFCRAHRRQVRVAGRIQLPTAQSRVRCALVRCSLLAVVRAVVGFVRWLPRTPRSQQTLRVSPAALTAGPNGGVCCTLLGDGGSLGNEPELTGSPTSARGPGRESESRRWRRTNGEPCWRVEAGRFLAVLPQRLGGPRWHSQPGGRPQEVLQVRLGGPWRFSHRAPPRTGGTRSSSRVCFSMCSSRESGVVTFASTRRNRGWSRGG